MRQIAMALLALVLMLAPTTPTRAQEAPEAAWQAVITAQIKAFRDKDAEKAFDYAAESFHVRFADAESFFLAIVGAGYAPIMESESHTFGSFERVGEAGVAQVVDFLGTDQQLYSALYQLTEEKAGWRVIGVALVKRPGLVT